MYCMLTLDMIWYMKLCVDIGTGGVCDLLLKVYTNIGRLVFSTLY